MPAFGATSSVFRRRDNIQFQIFMPAKIFNRKLHNGIERAIRVAGVVQLAVILIALVIFFCLPAIPLLSLTALIAGTIFVLISLGDLISAKRKSLTGQEVPFWMGLAKIVTWNPTEGVYFLKEKDGDLVDSNPDDGGGIRVVFPHLGEELVLRVPLEIQTLSFKDKEVLTKEYIPLAIQGIIYWKVVDLEKFYLRISKEVHIVNDTGKHDIATSTTRPKFEVAEYWLRAMAEEKTRSVVSQLGTGLLIADKLMADLPAIFYNQGENLFGGATPKSSPSTEGLADAIKTEFASSVNAFGLEIHRVALQEVQLPREIYTAAVDACKSAYLPIKARAEAIERKMKLQAEVDVIGKEAVGLKEIAANSPSVLLQASPYAMALQENLASFFQQHGKSPQMSKS